MSLLYPLSNPASGDAVVTNSAGSTGIQYGRVDGALPAALGIPLFQKDVSPLEEIVFDVQTSFTGTIGQFSAPFDFTLKKILLNAQPFIAPVLTLNVNALSTTNIAALTGLTTVVDGLKLGTDGMLVHLTGQTAGAQNGPWIVHAGAWTRPAAFATGKHFSGTYIGVQSGTLRAGHISRVTAANPDVIGTDASVWSRLTIASASTQAYSFFFDSSEDTDNAYFHGNLGVTIP